MHVLNIDLETYSSESIGDSGLYRYVASPDFEILLFAYAVDGGPVSVIDLTAGQKVPAEILAALRDPGYTKKAFNAAFEMTCLAKVFDGIDPSQWRCTMLHSLYCGYPGSLAGAGRALGMSEDKKKDTVGKALIRYFCTPCKPTKANGGRTRNLPKHDPDKWKLFIEYNRQDVVAEMAVDASLASFPVPDLVQQQWVTDYTINSRGVYADMDLVRGALRIGARTKDELMHEARMLSGLENPNSVSQLLEWVNDRLPGGEAVPDMRKETVAKLLDDEDIPAEVRRMLQIRQELGKTSTKKYDAIETCVCPDGRVRGLLQFYGANRTGRWAGRLVQVQNLPRTYTKNIEYARDLVRAGKGKVLHLAYGSVNDTLSQLIRTAFIATPGNVLVDADFSAIEARVISWLAGEQWRIKAFEDGKDIYCESASQMFGVPVVKHGENGHLRAKGKIAELALGYQGGPGALIAMGALDMGLTEEELPDIVSRWRTANGNIQRLWNSMNTAALEVIENGGSVTVNGRIILRREYDIVQGRSLLTITLPSGRKLFYISPDVGENRFGGKSITYLGLDQTTKQWKRLETYGGKLSENVVQAVARDCLAWSVERLERAGYHIVFHVHDEVVIDAPRNAQKSPEDMLKEVTAIMETPIPWAAGLPLGAAGWVGDFFTKD